MMGIKRDKRSVEQELWLQIFYLIFLASLGQYGGRKYAGSKSMFREVGIGTHLEGNKKRILFLCDSR